MIMALSARAVREWTRTGEVERSEALRDDREGWGKMGGWSIRT